MKVLNPQIHGIIDYVSVLALALAPTLFGLQGISAMLAYALAVIHLIMTALTAFPLGLIRLIPLKLHGLVELIVGVSLLVLPGRSRAHSTSATSAGFSTAASARCSSRSGSSPTTAVK